MRVLTTGLLLFIVLTSIAQFGTNPKDVTIIRDEWGIPHIYGKSDADCAYGLAWANAEDDFHNMQELLLAQAGLLSRDKGTKGAILDAVAFFIDSDGLVERDYDHAISEDYKKLLRAYAQAMNRYAELHPEEVRVKALFPIDARDLAAAYVTQMTFISNVHYDLFRIFKKTITLQEKVEFNRGSNAWALSPNISSDGKTYLVSNTHQPLRGPAAWYECHIVSEEGWNFYGATFPGGCTPFVGTNQHLGWTHTTNYDDFNDVYKLEMHPKKKGQYKYDGQWLELEERVLKLKVDLGAITLPVKRTFYWSKHGPVIKKKGLGYYAIRFPSNMKVNPGEQWYRMNKATNYAEFEAALRRQDHSNMNVIYADKSGEIFFLGNALFPYRNPDSSNNWQGVLDGTTSDNVWPYGEFYPIDSLVWVRNPECGYVFNMNHTSYNCSCPEENPDRSAINQTFGYQPKNTARAVRFEELMEGVSKIDYELLKRIKYDSRMPDPLYTRSLEDLEMMRKLPADKYPGIQDAIYLLRNWDGSTETDSRGAAIFSMATQFLLRHIRDEGIADYNNHVGEAVYAKAVRKAKNHLNYHFGAIDIRLGELQKHQRGDKVYPVWGIPEVLTQMYTVPWKDGMLRSHLGESFILFATYDSDGLEKVEAMMPYGSSNDPDSPHYNDQMEMYLQKQLRKVELERKVLEKKAERVYSPE